MGKGKKRRPRAGGAARPQEAGARPHGGKPSPEGNAARRAKGRSSRPLLRRREIWAAALVVVAAGAFVLLRGRKPGAGEARPRSGLNLLLITLDTTRADRLGCYGYAGGTTPNLDALAAQGVRFDRTYASVPLTLPSHASIMTGLLPPEHGVRNNGAYALGTDQPALAEILKGQGYSTAAFVASFSVDARFGLNRGFDLYDDRFQEGAPFKALNAERRAEQVYEAFSAWLERSPGQPFMAWLHFFDPHLPYSPPSPYREKFAGKPYDGEVAYMDYVIGAVMRKLRERGLLERTLVAIAGDHGESFGDHGESGHGVFVYDTALRVPFLLYGPGTVPEGKVVTSRVRLVDLMPTVLDLLQVPAPAGIEGQSLVRRVGRRRGPDRDVYVESMYPKENFGWAPLVGLVSGDWKLIHAPQDELYDLRRDPGETKNLAGTEKARAAEMGAKLEAALAAMGGATPAAGPKPLSADEAARLRSLGYVNYREEGAAGAAAPDPKSRLDELKMVQDAEKAEFDGDFAKAAELDETMLALRPAAASSYVALALAKARLKDFDAAIATLAAGLQRLPDSELLATRLGYTYLVTGRTQDALATMNRVLAVNPRSVDALTAVAVIMDNLDRKDDARDAFARALAVDPGNKFLRTGYAGALAATGRLAEAVAAYEPLVADYPKDVGLRRSLGIACGMSGDLDGAIRQFREITYIQPNPDAYFNLGLAFRQKGDAAEAARYFEQYLQKSAGEPEPKIRMAREELARLKK